MVYTPRLIFSAKQSALKASVIPVMVSVRSFHSFTKIQSMNTQDCLLPSKCGQFK